jgi:hypothetical protein
MSETEGTVTYTPPHPENLFGLPDLSKLGDMIAKAEALFAKVEEYIALFRDLYAKHKAEIDAVLALVRKVVEYLRGLSGEPQPPTGPMVPSF